MANYKVEFKLDGATLLSYKSSSLQIRKNLNDLSNTGYKGLFLADGDADLNSGSWLDGTFCMYDDAESLDCVLGDTLSNSDGTFSKEQSLEVSGSNIKYLVFKFDDVAGEYPTEIKIDDITITNNSYYLFVSFDNKSSIKITFTKWSKPNSLVKLLACVASITQTYTGEEINGLSYSNYSMSSANNLKSGIILQSGEVTVFDNGLLQLLSDNELINEGDKVYIYENDIKIQEFIIEKYDCNNYGTKWTFNLTDDLSELQNQQFVNLSYKDRTLKEIMQSIIPDLVWVNENFDITIPNSYLNTSTKWEALVKCCNIGFLNIYKVNGKIYCEAII